MQKASQLQKTRSLVQCSNFTLTHSNLKLNSPNSLRKQLFTTKQPKHEEVYPVYSSPCQLLKSARVKRKMNSDVPALKKAKSRLNRKQKHLTVENEPLKLYSKRASTYRIQTDNSFSSIKDKSLSKIEKAMINLRNQLQSLINN